MNEMDSNNKYNKRVNEVGKNEYKKLTILIILSIISMILFLIVLLMDLKFIIIFGLAFGFASDLYFLRIMITSLKSKDKWSVIINFNYYHEGIFELIFFTIIIGIQFVAIIMIFIII